MILKMAKKNSVSYPLKPVHEYEESSASDIESDKSNDPNKLGLLEVSPQGKYLVA